MENIYGNNIYGYDKNILVKNKLPLIHIVWFFISFIDATIVSIYKFRDLHIQL